MRATRPAAVQQHRPSNTTRRTSLRVAAAPGSGSAVVAAAAIATVPRNKPADSDHHQQQQPQPHHPHPHPQQQQHTNYAPHSASGRLLDSPARVHTSGSATVRVRDAGGDVSLDAYLRLPVEQYYILDPNQISFLEANRFQLSVPRINLLGVTLEPRIEVAVTTRADAVVLHATRCQLRGSGPLAALDEKFSMAFTTVITWEGGGGGVAGGGGAAGTNAAAAVAGPAAAGSSTGSSSSSSGVGGAQQAWESLRGGLQSWRTPGSSSTSASTTEQHALGSMTGSASIEVFCEVIPPFQLMPRDVLEGSCNAVLGGLVKSLLPVFMRQLAADYQVRACEWWRWWWCWWWWRQGGGAGRGMNLVLLWLPIVAQCLINSLANTLSSHPTQRWAADEAYRQTRAARSKPLV